MTIIGAGHGMELVSVTGELMEVVDLGSLWS